MTKTELIKTIYQSTGVPLKDVRSILDALFLPTPGKGVIAGGGVRAVVEAAGIRDILTKSLGSANILNVVMATVKALGALQDPAEVAARRGLPASQVQPFWSRKNG